MAAQPPDYVLTDADGVPIAHLDWGGDGPPIVLLHGIGDDAHEWDAIAPALTPYGRILAPNLPGHGRSARRLPDHTLGGFAVTLRAWADALDLAAPVLVGHSFGGHIALTAAARWPAWPRALALVDIGARAAPDLIPTLLADLRRRAGPYDLVTLTDAVCLGLTPDHWADAARLAVPVLLVRGARSPVLLPDEAARLARTIPDTILIEIPNVGHAIPQARPAELAAALTSWLGALDAQVPS